MNVNLVIYSISNIIIVTNTPQENNLTAAVDDSKGKAVEDAANCNNSTSSSKSNKTQ